MEKQKAIYGAPRWMLRVDLIWQTILLAPAVLAAIAMLLTKYETGLISLAIEMFLGPLQVISALFFALGYQDERRRYYLGIVIFYFIIVGLFFQTVPTSDFLFVSIGIIIPLGIACWYWWITLEDYNNSKGGRLPKPEMSEDILDDNFLENETI